MRTLGTRLLAVPLSGRLAEVGAWVDTGRVDIIVLCKVAHGRCFFAAWIILVFV